MHITNRKESVLLFLGDLIILTTSLWLMLVVRYLELPSTELFFRHFEPFAILFGVWVFVFFIAGLYEKHTLLLKSKLPATILNAQLVNTALAVVFFYTIPYFAITPKTNLFIYLVMSFGLILLWRNYGPRLLSAGDRENALLVASGDEMRELREEINENGRYRVKFVSSVDVRDIDENDFHKEIINRVYSEDVSLVVIDIHDENIKPMLPHLYNLIFSGIHFLDMHKVYEDVFKRVPVSLLQYSWFLDNLSGGSQNLYSLIKRVTDLIIVGVVAVPALFIAPLMVAILKINGNDKVYRWDVCYGQSNKPFHRLRFFTQTSYGDADEGELGLDIVKRFAGMPQLWNVFCGDMSLIGPSPVEATVARAHEKRVSHYDVRHFIKPGIFSWTDVAPSVNLEFQSNEDDGNVRQQLAFDLYYIKSRSIFLDMKIMLYSARNMFT